MVPPSGAGVPPPLKPPSSRNACSSGVLTRPSAATFDALPADRRAAILKVFDTAGTGDKAQAINDAVTVQTITASNPNQAATLEHLDGAGRRRFNTD